MDIKRNQWAQVKWLNDIKKKNITFDIVIRDRIWREREKKMIKELNYRLPVWAQIYAMDKQERKLLLDQNKVNNEWTSTQKKKYCCLW